jgi:3-oxoacyl-[acyl-carrier protein] reductase
MSEFPVAVITDWHGLAGPAICLQLARAGFSLFVNGPEDEVFELQSQDVGDGKILAMPFDPDQEDSVQQIFLAGLELFGRLDVLVNNYYAWNDAPLAEITDEMWNEVWRVNVRNTFNACRSAAPIMQAQEFGKIINVTTTSCLTGNHLQFAAASAALHSMTRSLARELAPAVRVNTVACGILDEPWIDEGGSELRQMLTKSIPLGRLCRTSDIADAVTFLASGADFMTGQMFVIDGGETVR